MSMSVLEIMWIRERQRMQRERELQRMQREPHHTGQLELPKEFFDEIRQNITRLSPPPDLTLRRPPPRRRLFITIVTIVTSLLAWPKSRLGTVTTPPLMTMDRIVRFFWQSKTYDRVFKPARADVVDDWEQAHIAGETRRAWYIKHILGRWIILSHVAAQIPSSTISFILKLLQISK